MVTTALRTYERYSTHVKNNFVGHSSYKFTVLTVCLLENYLLYFFLIFYVESSVENYVFLVLIISYMCFNFTRILIILNEYTASDINLCY